MRSWQRVQDALMATFSALAFLAFASLLAALAVVLGVRATQLGSALPALLAMTTASLVLAAAVLPPAMLLGIFLGLYWVEYHDERLAVLGRRVGRGMARLPDLFVALALVALASRGERISWALVCAAAFVPTLIYVATATSQLLDAIVPAYRSAALSLGVRRHRWIVASLLRIARRPLVGIGLVAFGRVLTAVVPLLVIAPEVTGVPLPLELLRHAAAPQAALFALALLVIVLVTKGLGRSMLAPGKLALRSERLS